MNTKEYFEKRALETERHSKERGEKYLEDLKKSYEDIEKQIQGDISIWYKKYADIDEKINNIDARKALNHNELTRYIDYIKHRIENCNLSEKDKEILRQRYLMSKLNRLESLLKQTQLNLNILTREYEISSKEHLQENYKQCYSETAYALFNCPTHNFALNFDAFDNRAIRQIVNTKWSNKDFSSRIWGHYSNMARDMESILNVGIALGYSVDKMSNQITDRMNVNFSNAKRLIRTESNYILSKATQSLYNDVELDRYQYLATLDYKTSEICQSLDNKIFNVKDMQIGVNCNPMHPNCRSTTIPYLEEYQDENDTRIARDMDGRSYKVPANYDYKAWYESMSEKQKDSYKLKRKMHYNKSSDKKAYEKYKEVLKNNAPRSLEEFQIIKYNDSNKWERLQDNYYVKSRIEKGIYNNTINAEKQEPHNIKTKLEGKSYIYGDTEFAQELFNKYAGSGKLEKSLKGRTHKEICIADDIVGFDVYANKKTNMFKIHHSKGRTHIVPYAKKE
ncbi:phage protein F-like protein [Peptoanaerobacter stomatis]|uniref:Phage protein F-like protein n=1 Tax=Peptoanaerobacter stomatis TaxID=796937 RepID=J5WDR4_9FIRM|nr:minor capsid protein [Peptoanaerobacter stomatis]EJU21192.1 phage protein F-like protein [Peptoanaerobacter stomatis]